MGKKNVYLIAGQSNAVGASLVKDLNAAVRAKRFSVMLYQAGDFSDGNENICNAWQSEIYCGMGGKPSYMGIETGIAERLAEIGSDNAVLRYAYGATNLAYSWNPLANKAPTDISDEGYCFFKWRETLVRGLKELEKTGGYNIRALVWMQGEGDATDKFQAERYFENLTCLAAEMRKQCDFPKMPFIVGEITTSVADAPWADVVRAAQKKFCETDCCAAFVPSLDLRVMSDKWHWIADDAYEMGLRFGSAIEKLCGQIV